MAFDHEPNHLWLYDSILSPRGYPLFCYQQDWLDFGEIEAVQPDLIIWGHMYGFDNRELDIVEVIRSRPQTQHLPVLLVTTASKLVLDIHKLQSLGNLYMLTKPFDTQQLLNAVEQALGSSHPEDVAHH